MATIYDEVYRRAHDDPEGFWAARAEDIHWEKRWDRVLDDSRPPYSRWFAGGVLNTCYNALDLHVERGRGKQTALIYDSPVTGTIRAFTYFELRDEVARFAGALRRQGVEKGDRVIIYMPAVPEAVIAMLACARIGAIHSVVFGGFAPKELATRIDDAKPKVMLGGLLRHRGQPGHSLQAAPGPGHRDGRAQAVALRDPAAADGGGVARAGPRRGLGRGGRGGRARRVRAGGRDGSALHPVHLGHHRHSQGRRPRQRRPRGRAQVEHGRGLRHGRGRDVLGGLRHRLGGRATPTSSTRRCSRAAPRSSTRASRSARPTPARSGASAPSTA